jgi:hypothetical protein
MAFINRDCSNVSVPKGTYGGSRCICDKCIKRRKDEDDAEFEILESKIKSAWEVYYQLQTKYRLATGKELQWFR